MDDLQLPVSHENNPLRVASWFRNIFEAFNQIGIDMESNELDSDAMNASIENIMDDVESTQELNNSTEFYKRIKVTVEGRVLEVEVRLKTYAATD